MPSTTPRLALPLLHPAQAHKETTHNEALLLADALILPIAQSLPLNTPPASPLAGQCWMLGAAPTGAWVGKSHQIALYSEGGWRFIAPFPGMTIWVATEALLARYSGTAWVIPGAIAAPNGGTTIDVEARGAIVAILATLQNAGLCDG
jgi:Protein of unknown function (DUF2793)